MERYRHYNITAENKITSVLNADSNVVFQGTEKQAKTWIDREWKLSQQSIRQGNLQSWYIGDNTWNIANETETVGKVRINTERKCVEDETGLKEFRIRTRNEMTVTARVLYNKNVTLDDKFIEYCGPKEAIKRVMKVFETEMVYSCLRPQLESEARKSKISEYELVDCFDSNRAKHCQNIARIL